MTNRSLGPKAQKLLDDLAQNKEAQSFLRGQTRSTTEIPFTDEYETRVRAYQDQGMTRSDALAVVDTIEDLTHQIDGLKEQIEQLERERTWQPIETAPKDGSILGWADDEEDGWQIMVVHWVEAEEDPDSKYVMHNAGWAGRILYPGGSPTGDPDEDFSPPTFTITHWMPRPQAPVADDE